MRLEGLIRVGEPPWRPTAAAGEAHCWHFHDVPLIGWFSQDGEDDEVFVFFCLGAAEAQITLWAYTRVGRAAADELDARAISMTLEQLQSEVARLFESSGAVFAIAEDLRLRLWTTAKVHDHVAKAAKQAVITMTRLGNGDLDLGRRAEEGLLSLA